MFVCFSVLILIFLTEFNFLGGCFVFVVVVVVVGLFVLFSFVFSLLKFD